jgi:hypothetical protein
MYDVIKLVGVLGVFALIIAVAGLANIWALNTLFPSLAIPYNFDTWLASYILTVSLFYNGKKN